MAGPLGSKCLTVAAGASYVSRDDFNAYSVVRLDLLEAVRSVKTFVVQPSWCLPSLCLEVKKSFL